MKDEMASGLKNVGVGALALTFMWWIMGNITIEPMGLMYKFGIVMGCLYGGMNVVLGFVRQSMMDDWNKQRLLNEAKEILDER